jgi:hypothetical protein
MKMNSYSHLGDGGMNRRLLTCGLVGWLIATAALRVAGQYVLRPGSWTGVVVLLGASFGLMACLMRGLCRKLPLRPEQRFGAVLSLSLPTLLLDPFSSAFFSSVFPNMDPSMAGVFGGWMLCCCAGAFVGVGLMPQGTIA